MYVCMLGLTVIGRQFRVKGRCGIRVGNGLLRFGLGSGVRAYSRFDARARLLVSELVFGVGVWELLLGLLLRFGVTIKVRAGV